MAVGFPHDSTISWPSVSVDSSTTASNERRTPSSAIWTR
jgi:hypothetical protein